MRQEKVTEYVSSNQACPVARNVHDQRGLRFSQHSPVGCVACVGVFPSAGVPAGYFQHENANSESPRGAGDGRPGPRSRSQLYVATLALFREIRKGEPLRGAV